MLFTRALTRSMPHHGHISRVPSLFFVSLSPMSSSILSVMPSFSLLIFSSAFAAVSFAHFSCRTVIAVSMNICGVVHVAHLHPKRPHVLNYNNEDHYRVRGYTPVQFVCVFVILSFSEGNSLRLGHSDDFDVSFFCFFNLRLKYIFFFS